MSPNWLTKDRFRDGVRSLAIYTLRLLFCALVLLLGLMAGMFLIELRSN